MLQGLRTIIYAVSDLGTATAWYRKLASKEPYFDEPLYVGFEIGGHEIGLIPDGDGATIYWGTTDIEAELTRVIALGAKPRSPTRNVGGDIKVATVTDPFGNVIGLIQNPHFKVGG
jgi:predicted enzyme related to lactoylglutathione lyase